MTVCKTRPLKTMASWKQTNKKPQHGKDKRKQKDSSRHLRKCLLHALDNSHVTGGFAFPSNTAWICPTFPSASSPSREAILTPSIVENSSGTTFHLFFATDKYSRVFVQQQRLYRSNRLLKGNLNALSEKWGPKLDIKPSTTDYNLALFHSAVPATIFPALEKSFLFPALQEWLVNHQIHIWQKNTDKNCIAQRTMLFSPCSGLQSVHFWAKYQK